MSNEFIKVACFRTGSDYASQSSADLAVAISQDVALVKMTIMPFFQQIIAAGGVQSEVAPLYKYSEFMADLKGNLEKGDLAAVRILVSLAKNIVTFTAPTTEAITTVITVNSLSLIDVVANELGEAPPGAVSAADIDTALGR